MATEPSEDVFFLAKVQRVSFDEPFVYQSL
jgi:hypothetical protein